MSTTPTHDELHQLSLARLEARAIVHGGLVHTTPGALAAALAWHRHNRVTLDLSYAELARVQAALCRGYAAAHPVATDAEHRRHQLLVARRRHRSLQRQLRTLAAAMTAELEHIGVAMGNMARALRRPVQADFTRVH